MPRLLITDRAVLVRLILSQPEMTRRALADEIGVAENTVGAWDRGVSLPDDLNTGSLVAIARQRFKVGVGPELAACAKLRSNLYMREYMRLRREQPGRIAAERVSQEEYRQRNRERRAAAERERYAAMSASKRAAVLAARRERRRNDVVWHDLDDDEQNCQEASD